MKKSRKFLIFLLGAIMCLSLAIFAGCSDDDETIDGDTDITDIVESTATITYDSNGGSEVEQTTVDFGSTVTLPTPTRDGYNFMGWYYTYNSTEIEFTENIPVVADITLTAKWSKSYDLYLYNQSAAIVETGSRLTVGFGYEGYITDGYMTIEKNGTVYTEDEAIEAGWLSDSNIYIYSYSIYGYLYFATSGDYTIYAYANGDVASTCVTVEGNSLSTIFTGSSVSVDSIEYLDTTYANGSEITTYDFDCVYVYFNAPEDCEARVTYTDGTKTYVADYGSGVEDGKYYVEIWSCYSNYTYTVNLTSIDYGTATATFTTKAAAITDNIVFVQPTDVDTYTGYGFDYYYYIAGPDIDNISYMLTDAEGNEINSYDGYIHFNCYQYSSGIYTINYWGSFYSECNYKLIITPYDSNGDAITDLTQTINITISEYSSSSSYYWDIDTTAEGYDADYSSMFFTDETKSFTYVASGEMKKVILSGTNVPVGGSATLTLRGVPVKAECKVSDGNTYLTLTLSSAEDFSSTDVFDYLYFYVAGTTSDGVSRTSGISISVYNSETMDFYNTIVSAYKYSLETYFADYIAEDGELCDIYTSISSFTTEGKSYKDIYDAVEKIISDGDIAIYSFSGNVYNTSEDYVGTWLTILDAKTSLYDIALIEYAYAHNCYYQILDGYSVSDNEDIFFMGMSEYLLVKTSDKVICDYLYNYCIDMAEAEAYYTELYNNLVEAHDNGTEAEYIAAINAIIIAMY